MEGLAKNSLILPIALIVGVVFCRSANAEDPSFFDHNYAATGIVRPGNSRIAPEVKAPEKPADQMLQTEAKIEPRDKLPRAGTKLRRQKSFEGRFVSRQGGTEVRTVPYQLGEAGPDLP